MRVGMKSLVTVDFFTVPTLRFQILYVFLALAHERRRILHFGVTAHPTAEWTAPTPGGLSVGQCAPLSAARSRSSLRAGWEPNKCCRPRARPGSARMWNG